MLSLRVLPVALALFALPHLANAQQVAPSDEVVDKIVAQEQAEIQLLRRFSPLVETYIQYLHFDKQAVVVPDGDKYFLGRSRLEGGVQLELLEYDPGLKRKLSEDWREFVNIGFAPGGFLQMIYVATSGFDRQHYRFEYVHREFLGEVRCLVFDIAPLRTGDKGRFTGRIWVEDQDYHIVRFNGTYGQSSVVSSYFNFDSWRTNSGTNMWLPAFVYSEQGNPHDPHTMRLSYKPFRAQTRLWGYHLAHADQEQDLSKIIVEDTTINDQTQTAKGYSPLEEENAWERQAESNVIRHLESHALLAPPGEVDKVLNTVVNNIEVTNKLDLQPEVQCCVLMTLTLETFTIGHTIVVSRGLLDVLPDEASLAAILALELSHIVLGHGSETQFAFYNKLQFQEKNTFRQMEFTRTKAEEQAAQYKANDLLLNSPYGEKCRSAQLFILALQQHSKELPNLVSPRLGDKLPTNWTITVRSSVPPGAKSATATVAALPLGGRVEIDPWSDQLQLAKNRPQHPTSDADNLAFRITPFYLYLTRQQANSAPPPAPADNGPSAPTSALNSEITSGP
jgi:Peptidase family M48